MTYYKRLGVTPSASTDEIRGAYLDLAKQLHPDRLHSASEADQVFAERRMREINEAWATLQDPDRRHAYDESLWTGADRARARQNSTPPPDPEVRRDPLAREHDVLDLGPDAARVKRSVLRHLPWMLLVGVLIAIFVVTAYLGKDANDQPNPGGPAAGRCVTRPITGAVTDVPCTTPNTLKIVSRVDAVTPCPQGTTKRQLFADGLWDCVTPN